MWTFSWVSHFSHLWKIRQVHHHHKWLQTTSPPRMLTRAPCYHSKQRPIHRGTQKLLLFRAKLVVDNKGERKLVCGTLKTTISGQPSVQCILQQRLPKALNSGSQNSQQISSADSREGSCQSPSGQGHKPLWGVQATSGPSREPSITDLPQVLSNPSPDSLGGEEPQLLQYLPFTSRKALPTYSGRPYRWLRNTRLTSQYKNSAL